MQLQNYAEDYEEAGIGMVVITYDSPDLQEEFVNAGNLTYQFISDIDATTMNALGILNEQYSPADHGYAHIALQVSDIHEEYGRLIEAGMTFHEPPVELGGSLAIYGRDPFGNIVELYEPSKERSI